MVTKTTQNSVLIIAFLSLNFYGELVVPKHGLICHIIFFTLTVGIALSIVAHNFFFLFILIFFIFSIFRHYVEEIKLVDSGIVNLPRGNKRVRLINKINAIREIMHRKKCSKSRAVEYFFIMRDENWVTRDNKIMWKKMNKSFKDTVNYFLKKKKAHKFFIDD